MLKIKLRSCASDTWNATWDMSMSLNVIVAVAVAMAAAHLQYYKFLAPPSSNVTCKLQTATSADSGD
jgi:hypothetical protein